VQQKKMNVDMANESGKSKSQEQIDANLKRIYDETLQQKIPDRLTDLLAQLRARAAADAKPREDGEA
jgi:DNA-binding transcriptional regulator WhiA